jgi:hypothetical protein
MMNLGKLGRGSRPAVDQLFAAAELTGGKKVLTMVTYGPS